MVKATPSIKIALVVPAYNEAAVIGDVIKGLQSEFKKSAYDFDIIVVDDGSNDDTANISREAGATVIKHILNSGAGAATATGLSYANQKSYDIAATLDADGQHHPGDVLLGITTIEHSDADLLIGSRLIDSRGMSRVKQLGNRGLSLITFLTFGVHSTDSQSGLRVYSRQALKSLRWKTSGYEFCSEMLWRAKQIGLVIKEYPIRAIYTDYSKSKGQNNWNSINIVKSIIKRRIAEMFG